MAKTLKNLVMEYAELQQRERIWDEIKTFLGMFVPSKASGGDARTLKMEDGRVIDSDVFVDILSDIDADIVEPMEKRIAELEAMEVDTDGKKRRSTRGKAGGKARSDRKGSS